MLPAALIKSLQETEDLYPGSTVVLGDTHQVIHNQIPGMNGAKRILHAPGGRNVGGSMLVTISKPEEPINGSE